MARSGSHLHMRFRKSFPIIGHHLKMTVSKRGLSLNAHAGIFSRSWGTRYNTETIDAPGHMGLFWRKQSSRHHGKGPKVEGWHLAAFLITLLAAVEAAHLWLHPLSHCTTTGGALTAFITLVGVLFVGLYFLHKIGLNTFLVLLVVIAGIYAQWKIFGSVAWHDVHCVATKS